jgi:UDP-N-acetyl-D-mannosaminuronate dehydrogenase
VICTDHSAFDYDRIARDAALIVDSRNALKNRKELSIFRL